MSPATIEPAHDALLRQWSLLQGWLKEDAAFLTVLDDIKRAARDWTANERKTAWLLHAEDRLRAAEGLLARPDLAANLETTDKEYVASCRNAGQAAQARMQMLVNGYRNGTYEFGERRLIIVQANNALEKLFGETRLIDKDLRNVLVRVYNYIPKLQRDKFKAEQAALIGGLILGDYNRPFGTIPIYFIKHPQFNNRAFMPLIYSFSIPEAGPVRLRVVYIDVTSFIKKHPDDYYYCDPVETFSAGLLFDTSGGVSTLVLRRSLLLTSPSFLMLAVPR
jgi:hypothetical protein